MSRYTKEEQDARYKRIEELKPIVEEANVRLNRSDAKITEELNNKGILDPSGNRWTKANVTAFKTRYLKAKKGEATTGTPIPQDTPIEVYHDGDIKIPHEEVIPEEKQETPVETIIPQDTEGVVCPEPIADVPPGYETPSAEVYQKDTANILQQKTEPIMMDNATMTVLTDFASWWQAGGKEKMMNTATAEAPTIIAHQFKPKFAGAKRNSSIRVVGALLDDALAKAKDEIQLTGGTVSSLLEVLLWRYLDSDPKYIASGIDPRAEEEETDGPVGHPFLKGITHSFGK